MNKYPNKRSIKQHVIYSRSILTKQMALPINVIGNTFNEVIEKGILDRYEGKCIEEGFLKPGSIKILSHSCGTLIRGVIHFEVAFECDLCNIVEGMLLPCVVTNNTKAGIQANLENEYPSPVVVFIAKDHHYNLTNFNDYKKGDKITARVIGQRFELNDKCISVIAELVTNRLI